MDDFLERMRAEHPEVVARTERMIDELLHPLTQFRCPRCDIRFGVDVSDWRFAEQVGDSLFCPRGHELSAQYPERRS